MWFRKLTNILSWVSFAFVIYFLLALVIEGFWDCRGGDVPLDCGATWKTAFVNYAFLGGGWGLFFLGMGVYSFSIGLSIVVLIEGIYLAYNAPQAGRKKIIIKGLAKLGRSAMPFIITHLYLGIFGYWIRSIL